MGPTPDAPGTEPWWSPTRRRPHLRDDGAGPAEAVGAPDGSFADHPPPGRPGRAGPLGLTRAGRPARAPRPGRLPPARAVAGALVAVAGVALGIGTLLWATGGLGGPPAGDPTVRPPPSVEVDGRSGTGDPPGDDVAGRLDVPAVPPPDADLSAAPPPVAEPAPDSASLPADDAAAALVVPVVVLNNSRIPRLAERVAEQLEAGGWPVRETGNLRGRIRASTVYYPPGQEASARELARRFPGLRRVLPRLPNLPGTGLTVVVTRDYPV